MTREQNVALLKTWLQTNKPKDKKPKK